MELKWENDLFLGSRVCMKMNCCMRLWCYSISRVSQVSNKRTMGRSHALSLSGRGAVVGGKGIAILFCHIYLTIMVIYAKPPNKKGQEYDLAYYVAMQCFIRRILQVSAGDRVLSCRRQVR